jgi:hypothetical protein
MHTFQSGYYACGMTVQQDTNPGTDLTSINGFKFHLCSRDQWFPDFDKDVYEQGPFGEWQ